MNMQRKLSKKLKKIPVGFGLSVIIVFLIIILGNVQDPYIPAARTAAEPVEYLFYDMFFKVATAGTEAQDNIDDKVSLAQNYDPNILIVDIDEPSLAKLGNYNEWDRSIHANVVKNLGNGGASAIGFDILFKNADFGKQKAAQATRIMNKFIPSEVRPSDPEDNFYIYDSTLTGEKRYFDSLKVRQTFFDNIQKSYNYDSLLIEAVRGGGNSIVCFTVEEAKAYKHESQWRPLSTIDRAIELGFESSFANEQIDHPENIENKELLDNIFPELAHAAAHMGSVNAYPDNDGVVRHVSMLYRFPDPNLYPDEGSRIYSTMSLMTILHLFHQDPANVQVKMGEYIDVGKPFGVYRDYKGKFHTTYPGFSYPMFLSLRDKLKKADIDNSTNDDFIDVSSKIIATRNAENGFSFEIFEGQLLESILAEALIDLDTNAFNNLGDEEERDIGKGITIKKDEEGEGRFILTDVENEEEAVITPYIVKAIHFFKDSLIRLPANKPTFLSMDMDIRYDHKTSKWESNLVILSDSVLKEIRETGNSEVDGLKGGAEYRFGPVKRIPIDNYGRFLVNYQGRYNTNEANRAFQHISYYDVTKNRIDPGFYQGKIFILGSAAPALFDFVPAPHEEKNPAVLIHATILQNILKDKYMVMLNENYQQIIVILLALVCLLIGLFVRSYISITLSVIMMASYTFIAYRYFQDGVYIGVAKQLLVMLLTNIIALIVQFYYESKEKRFLGNAFKQYISPELIDEMVNNEIMPTLGGSKSDMTAYFTDIQGFSTFSEKIGDPTRLVELLNEYLTSMTDTLLRNKGTLDKYEGDAIIAFFGAPMPLPNHAQSACDAAVEMQQELMKLRKKWIGEGDKWPKIVHDMHMRIGINSGNIVTGNMGSTMRKNYTMMGDAVNLGARLESAAKQYGAYIQISEDTEKHLEKGRYIYRSLDTIRVIGKSQPVKTYELLTKVGSEDEEVLNKLVDIWERARAAYLAMDWDKAIELFTECLDYEPHHPDRDPGSRTTPSHVYIKRCQAYKINPPVPAGETWDGVFTATEK